jgi:hypothetical protein
MWGIAQQPSSSRSINGDLSRSRRMARVERSVYPLKEGIPWPEQWKNV